VLRMREEKEGDQRGFWHVLMRRRARLGQT
jgi:hypothetical protein